MNIAERIKILAKEHNISIAELERKTGISNGQIAKWDVRSPKSDNLEKVANYFHVSTDYLLGRTNDPHIYEEENEMPTTEYRAIQRKAKKLNPSQQERLLKMMDLTFEEVFNKDDE